MDLENHLQSHLNLQYPCVLWRGLAKLLVAVETTIWWMKVDEDYRRRLHYLYCWLLHMMCYDCSFLMIILPLFYWIVYLYACGLSSNVINHLISYVLSVYILSSRDHPSSAVTNPTSVKNWSNDNIIQARIEYRWTNLLCSSRAKWGKSAANRILANKRSSPPPSEPVHMLFVIDDFVSNVSQCCFYITWLYLL